MMSKLNSNSERSRKRRKLSPQPEVDNPIASDEAAAVVNESSAKPTTTQLPSVKDLASSESSKRRAALKVILNHLNDRPANSNLSSTECLQLWKGFFVAIYMHDSKNAISVQNLLKEVASTFVIFDDKENELRNSGVSENVNWLERYHVAFWQTLVVEWAGIDSHRMNKYLLLVRFVTRELAKICLRPLFQHKVPDVTVATNGKTRKRKVKAESEKQTTDAVEEQNSGKIESISRVLQTVGPLNTKDRKIPDGLRLHLLDLYVTEIFSALSSIVEEVTDEVEKPGFAEVQKVLTTLRLPVVDMSQSDSGAPRNIRQKAREALEEFNAKEEEMQESF